jgi:hypothetical protein
MSSVKPPPQWKKPNQFALDPKLVAMTRVRVTAGKNSSNAVAGDGFGVRHPGVGVKFAALMLGG